jgi:predicted Rossmann fold nucleotide-binding protein DprA/Smf involved in DNA uptake
MENALPTLGDSSLLSLPKTAFLSSRRVEPSAVMRCYDWATSMRDAGKCVIGGFQSTLERDVFQFLLRGTSPIIMVLARSLWKTVPKEYREPIASGRLLVVSPVSQSVRRVSEETAMQRNGWILDHCDEAVFAALDPNGSLSRLVAARPNLHFTVLSRD